MKLLIRLLIIIPFFHSCFYESHYKSIPDNNYDKGDVVYLKPDSLQGVIIKKYPDDYYKILISHHEDKIIVNKYLIYGKK